MSDKSSSRDRQRQRPGNRGNDRPVGGQSGRGEADRPEDLRGGGGNAGGGSGGNAGGGGNSGGGAGKARSPMSMVAAAAVAVAIAAGAFFAFGGGADQISDAESQSRADAYATFVAGSAMPLTYVSSGDVDQAIADMPESVSEEQRVQLKQDIDSGQVKLAWLSLWDTHAEDGDILRFESSSSFPIDVMALNAKTTIAIPFPADGKVKVTGVKDGGGGITIALESGATQIAWPTMAPGDTLDLPVTPGF